MESFKILEIKHMQIIELINMSNLINRTTQFFFLNVLLIIPICNIEIASPS